MDDHKTVSVSRVYVPNEYALYLSPRDREQFRGYEASLLEELAAYVAEHARREGYALVSAPRVTLHEDADLAVGEFGIATHAVQTQPVAPAPAPPAASPSPPVTPPAPPPVASAAPPPPAAPTPEPPAAVAPPGLPVAPPGLPVAPPTPPVAPPADPGGTRVYEPEELVQPAAAVPAAFAPRAALLAAAGVRHALDRPTLTLGRSKECDVVVEDPSASRRHAEVRAEGGDYWLIDLGSTNGTEVNGKRVDRARLEPGDVITVGQTQLRFERVA